ncbi:hypothetical protein L596_025630 [Steinernema carpocapsae]|uniref:Kinesin-like protein n=1 Tax=Steinernema carpocapsae TaxID=34508 RepID=A0A4U5M8B1_STECR|nr:hypothetical protein L596_025630 [Steinernema carpocapsae]
MSHAKRPAAKPKKQNIQVAVRVRPLNSSELSTNAKNIVILDHVAKAITLKDRTGSRVYQPYDKIYGEKESQATVYNDLIAPLVGEVLSGYNCTVFVYGQTGTGKTYTMEGRHDDSGEYSWQNDPSSGVIPRALHHIFSELEKQELEEYSVRVSYLELYNEELYDLLGASDLKNTRLRIFEDPMKKGSVVINGMEEVPVKDREEVYKLLKRGAERRQTAATLMNMNSSRSHSVFTVTVVIRENSVSGEELLKQGKLHLVDLAGSENVKKSGAQDTRAREAGNINQSLLTLGRVINSLTSNAGHIPYRESKLTRILQDSLGGRTITTLIATLSPASSNFEETVNTLEYALRAKNIKNHPEVNEKLSRRALLKEYNEEIERLRKDLMAAREQNGVYLDAENYEGMVEQIQHQTERIERIEGELEGVLSKFQRALSDIEMMESHYRRVYDRNQLMHSKLEKRRFEVEQLSKDLAATKHTLEATEYALAESQKYGETARSQNIELGETCTILSSHLDKTHHKIDELKAMFVANDKLYGDFTAERIHKIHDLDSVLQKCRSKVQDVSNETSGLVDASSALIQDLCISIRSIFSDTVSRIESYASNFTASLESDCYQHLSTLKTQSMESQGVLASIKAQNSVALIQLEALLQTTVAVFGKIHEDKEKFVEDTQKSHGKAEKQRGAFTSQMKAMIEQQTKLFNESLAIAAQMEKLNSENDVEVKTVGQELREVEEKFAQAVDLQSQEALQKCQEEADKGRDAIGDVERLSSDLSSTISASFEQHEEQLTVTRDAHVKTISEFKEDVISQTSNSLASEISTQTSETVFSVKANCNIQAATVETAVGDAAQRLQETQHAIEEFIHEKVQRPQSSGQTPEKTKFPTTGEIPSLASADDLKSSFYASRQEFKRRKPIRTRESLFENEFPVMSPVSLQKMLGSLEENDENEPETMNEMETISAKSMEIVSPEHASKVSRRGRRRVLQSGDEN